MTDRNRRCASCIVHQVYDCPHVYDCPVCGAAHACYYPMATEALLDEAVLRVVDRPLTIGEILVRLDGDRPERVRGAVRRQVDRGDLDGANGVFTRRK